LIKDTLLCKQVGSHCSIHSYSFSSVYSHFVYWLNSEVDSFRLAQELISIDFEWIETSSIRSNYHGNKFVSKKNNIVIFSYAYNTKVKKKNFEKKPPFLMVCFIRLKYCHRLSNLLTNSIFLLILLPNGREVTFFFLSSLIPFIKKQLET
jgi:hypothetical protein